MQPFYDDAPVDQSRIPVQISDSTATLGAHLELELELELEFETPGQMVCRHLNLLQCPAMSRRASLVTEMVHTCLIYETAGVWQSDCS